MSYAQYLRQLLRPLGVYDVEGRYLSGELEAEGLALDGVESVLDELQREANLATAEDWGLERIAGLLRRRPPASTTKAMREALGRSAAHQRRQLYPGGHQRHHCRLRSDCPGG